MAQENTIDFFLVGAARCGTTSLYNYLNNSDDIFLPKVKEPNFFSDVDSPKLEDYELPKPDMQYHAKIINSKAIYDSLYIESIQSQLKGDTSPSYLWDKNVAKKLFEHNPDAKIIISLRHPVDRAYSHYIMNYYTGFEKNDSFEKALKAKKNFSWGSCNQYLEMSMYYEQVKAYFDVFPREQILVLVYEDWSKNLKVEINRIFSFLGVKINDDEVYSKKINTNRIQNLKNLKLLNFFRQRKVKGLIRNILNQQKIDKLKTLFFNDNGEIEKIDSGLRFQLSNEFHEDLKKLSHLVEIDLNENWKLF